MKFWNDMPDGEIKDNSVLMLGNQTTGLPERTNANHLKAFLMKGLVVDNLESDSSDLALSARMGKELNTELNKKLDTTATKRVFNVNALIIDGTEYFGRPNNYRLDYADKLIVNTITKTFTLYHSGRWIPNPNVPGTNILVFVIEDLKEGDLVTVTPNDILDDPTIKVGGMGCLAQLQEQKLIIYDNFKALVNGYNSDSNISLYPKKVSNSSIRIGAGDSSLSIKDVGVSQIFAKEGLSIKSNDTINTEAVMIESFADYYGLYTTVLEVNADEFNFNGYPVNLSLLGNQSVANAGKVLGVLPNGSIGLISI